MASSLSPPPSAVQEFNHVWRTWFSSLQEKLNLVSSATVQYTPVPTTSGTYTDFSNIPSGTKRITVYVYKPVATGTGGTLILRLGDAGGIESSGYTGASGSVFGASPNSTSFLLGPDIVAYVDSESKLILTLMDSTTNTWALDGTVYGGTGAYVNTTVGLKPLTEELTTVRITTSGGSATFTGGTAYLVYE